MCGVAVAVVVVHDAVVAFDTAAVFGQHPVVVAVAFAALVMFLLFLMLFCCRFCWLWGLIAVLLLPSLPLLLVGFAFLFVI